MVQAAVDKWGRVDYAVNSAGASLYPSSLLLSPPLLSYLLVFFSLNQEVLGWMV